LRGTHAQNFVLQDNLFEPNASWSLPQHLFMVSEWSAKCSQAGDPMSCINALQSPQNPNLAAGTAKTPKNPKKAAAQAEKDSWERRVSGLRTMRLDADTLDERARAMLNLAEPSDVIVPYSQKEKLF
ncbi:MAG: hypothetical protein J0H99_19805, partial [Rhodospirillales bacterium]|nr:hypothetical protein [Rhodospirillales bacterium]